MIEQLQVTPLSDVMGAEITGLDLRKPLTKEVLDYVFNVFYKYRVIVFKNQELMLQKQIEACKQFGALEKHPLHENTCPYEEITIMSNVTQDGKPVGYSPPPFLLWHSDLCYLPKPAKMTFLYAHTVPEKGGDTIFANTCLAYKNLPEKVRKQVEDKRAVFGSGENLMERCHKRGFNLQIDPKDIHPDVIHPVIRTHPVTGEKSIFVNWTHTDRIIGLEKKESDDLLNYLYEHSVEDRHTYQHSYKEGDLIVWDNASTLHSPTYTDPQYSRTMHRVVVQGSTPY